MTSQDKQPNDGFDVNLLEGLRERISQDSASDEEMLSSNSTRKSIMFGGLIGLAAAAGAAWFVLGGDPAGEPIPTVTDVPVIKAEKAQVKVRPADPGGMAVPNQDKLVYDRVNNAEKKPEVEHLLPPPKEPKALPTTADGLGDGMAPLPKAPHLAESKAPAKVVKAAPVAAPKPVVKAKPTPAPKPVAKVAAKSVVAPAKKAPAPVAALKSTAGTKGDWQVQLAALRDVARAESAWTRTVSKAPATLKNVPHEVIRADLGSKGVFYRLRAGNFTSRAQASSLCTSLKAKGVGCVVAKR